MAVLRSDTWLHQPVRPTVGVRTRGTSLAAMAFVAFPGAVLLGAAWAVQELLPANDPLQPWAFPARMAGLVILLVALTCHRRLLSSGLPRMGLGLGTTLSLLVLAETICRAVGWDFRRERATWKRLPPFTREARTPTGTVFFRREGPEAWTGAVLRSSLELRGRTVPPAYLNEPSIEVRYDRDGFRESSAQTDWELAIAGDSFTELGCLPHDDLFTTLVGQELDLRVRNLGVSGTGPFTQLHYLREFGDAPGLQQVGIVFFEGNDLDDLGEEIAAMDRHAADGVRPLREFNRQTSFLGGLAELVRGKKSSTESRWELPWEHHFAGADGRIRVHLTAVPLVRRHLPEDTSARLDRFCSAFEAFGRSRRVRTWLAYMPCKARVLFPRLVDANQTPRGQEAWWPTELPARVEKACRRHGVRFLDLTPALLSAARDRGELVFNPLWDFHLNALGSRRVAEELVRQLGELRPSGQPASASRLP